MGTDCVSLGEACRFPGLKIETGGTQPLRLRNNLLTFYIHPALGHPAMVRLVGEVASFGFVAECGECGEGEGHDDHGDGEHGGVVAPALGGQGLGFSVP